MTRLVVFGAGGRAGRAIVTEAQRRGLDVTAVVRDPSRYEGVAIRGDVTSAADVQLLVDGQDAVVSAASPADDPEAFFPAVAGTLVAAVGDRRLVLVGIGTTLPSSSGGPIWQAEGFPQAGIEWSRAHARELELLQDGDGDWLVVAPPPVLLEEADYAELAAVVVAEVASPRHRRTLLAVRPDNLG